MEIVAWGLLFFFGYPFLVYLMASSPLRRRVESLEFRLNTALKELQALRAGPVAEAPQPPPVQAPEPEVESEPQAPIMLPVAVPVPLTRRRRKHRPAPAPAALAAAEPQPPAPPRPAPVPAEPMEAPAWVRAIRAWLFRGNLVAKLGLLILFIGVSFLLKYAAERVTVPIELRLAGIVVADIALLAWGWRLRATRPGLSLPIQGGALAILMLVTFGAFRLYHLIPSSLAFGLLFVLTACTCVLAVLQNAFWLAVFGIAGGFLAPILTSTGQGSHIALFSYYALLNAGILAIAVKRTWRVLNLIGFAFTFTIGASWGALRYLEADYLSAQLFLLLFFAYYVALAVIYALRQSVALKAYVDATLVFGTPLAGFALQFALVREREFGAAWSALGFGLFYTALALALWRRRAAGIGMLVEAFMALGVVFGTLAIPFALDGRWTSAAWALEGAGVVWVALRQRQRLPFWFGMLVQAGAWISFIGAVSGLSADAAREANLWLGFLILAASAFFMAVTLRRHRDNGIAPLAPAGFLADAALWLLAGLWTEIVLRQHGTTMFNLLAGSGLAVALILAVIARRMQWRIAGGFGLAVQTTSGVALLLLTAGSWDWSIGAPQLFSQPLLGALMVCGAALFTSRITGRMPEQGLRGVSRFMLGWGAFWWFGPILHCVAGFLTFNGPLIADAGAIHTARSTYLYILASFSALGAALAARRLQWPDARWLSAAAWVALGLASAMLLELLYDDEMLPGALEWAGFALTWGCAEYLLQRWRTNDWQLSDWVLKTIHLVRTGAPWLMLWKAGELAITAWLIGADGAGPSLVSASWSNFVPAWAMMAIVAWLTTRARSGRWPTAPLAAWYRAALIPVAAACALLLTAAWNLAQDGSMAPLPYLPVLNPLDLTTAFALALGVFAWRMARADEAIKARHERLLARLPLAGTVAAYVWFNLILLRSAAHLLAIPYRIDELFDSLFVQAMLSLVWSVTALVLMRRAARRAARRGWMVGAGFLALVVAKLFLVDLDGTGSVARIVSFVGVGLLMVLIGYLAPYPADSNPEPVRQGA